jgi:hypothetical protein
VTQTATRPPNRGNFSSTLEQHLGDVCIGIALDPSWSADSPVYTADLAVNMAARLYGQLNLRGSDAWVASASRMAAAINPNVEITSRAPTVSVSVGNSPHDGETVFARTDGWVARLLRAPAEKAPGPANPLTAGMAAGLAMAEVFRRVFRARLPAQRLFQDVSVSLLDFSPDAGADEELKTAGLGNFAFAGVGAVGNAAVSALSRFDALDGEVLLLDEQAIDLGNLQRYVLATMADDTKLKVHLAADALARTGLHIRSEPLALEDAADTMTLPPVIAVSVDNIPTRRAVQALLPRLAVNGWTSEQGLGASWHEFGENGPCLACDYQPTGASPSQYDIIIRALGLSRDRVFHLWLSGDGVTDEDLNTAASQLSVNRERLEPWLGMRLQDFFTDVVCGQVAMDLSDGRGPLEAVPLSHQSVIAGILMATELVKRTNTRFHSRAQSTAMLRWDDVLQATPKRWTLVRAAAPSCICQDEIYRRRYRSKWSGVTRTSH